MSSGTNVLEMVRNIMRLAAGRAGSTNSANAKGPQNGAAIADVLSTDPIYSSIPLHQPKMQIRLVELLPSHPDDLISINLFVADGVDAHPYEALSYVWGPRDADVTITVNGRPFSVSANLAAALRCLQPASDRPGRILWIDAICINQASDVEKSTQVAMMGEIYRGAAEVLVFLGEEKDNSAMVMQYLELAEPDTADDAENVAEDQNDKRVMRHIQRCGFSPAQFFCAADAFFKRPWWSRLWVVQEFALAHRPPRWYCGTLSVPTANLRERLIHLFNCFFNQALPAVGSPDVILDTQIDFSSQAVIMPQRRHNIRLLLSYPSAEWEGLLPFSALIRVLYRESTDPRDRIYALREMLEPVSREVFFPDYSMPVDQVFLRLSSFLAVHGDWKDAICKYMLMRSPDMPSWALDFTRPFPGASFVHFGILTSPRTKVTAASPVYNRVLGVSGIVLDKLDILCPLEDATNDFHILGLFWKMEGLLRHHRAAEVLPDDANSAVPKHCYIPFPEGRLKGATGWNDIVTTPLIPGFAHVQLELAKLALYPAPRYLPENLTCDRWQGGPRRPGDIPLMRALLSAALQPDAAESFLGGVCFDSANFRAQIQGVTFPGKNNLGSEHPSDMNSDTSVDPGGGEYIPQYNYIKNILLQAGSEAELGFLKEFIGFVANLCAATVREHLENRGLSASQSGWEFTTAFNISHTSLTSSWREIFNNCSCSADKRDRHRDVLEKILTGAEKVRSANEALLQEACNAVNRIHLDSWEPANQTFASLKRQISGIFVSRRGFVGCTLQTRPGLKRGDILAMLDGVPAPVILEEAGCTGRYRLKAFSNVVGIQDVDVVRLAELGLGAKVDFHIV